MAKDVEAGKRDMQVCCRNVGSRRPENWQKLSSIEGVSELWPARRSMRYGASEMSRGSRRDRVGRGLILLGTSLRI